MEWWGYEGGGGGGVRDAAVGDGKWWVAWRWWRAWAGGRVCGQHGQCGWVAQRQWGAGQWEWVVCMRDRHQSGLWSFPSEKWKCVVDIGETCWWPLEA